MYIIITLTKDKSIDKTLHIDEATQQFLSHSSSRSTERIIRTRRQSEGLYDTNMYLRRRRRRGREKFRSTEGACQALTKPNINADGVEYMETWETMEEEICRLTELR